MNIIGEKKSGSLWKIFFITLYCGFLLLIALFAYKRPLCNWDMLAYMALSTQQDNGNADQLQQATYKAAKENIPATDYQNLLGGDHRRNLATDPKAFFATLPFYAVKPLYIKMVSLFHAAGFSLPMSTMLPSVIFYFLIGLLLFYWLLQYLKIIWAFSLSTCIMLSGFMVFMARLSTPDCMSAFFLLAAFWFIIEKPSVPWAFLFLVLAIFTRLDNIVSAFFILSFLFFSKKWEIRVKIKYYLLMMIILVLCYFGITIETMRPFGWNIFYYPTYALHMNLSHESLSSFSLKPYLALVVSQLITGIVFYNFMSFFLLLLLSLYPSFKQKNIAFDQVFSVLLLFVIVCRFILYPDLADRFNIAYYMFFLIALIKKYAKLFSEIRPLSAEVN